ncbi:MAG: PAS domain S-box protein [Longimonas sp.]|uniref:sensor histidine kinase n=1 Tax=Longimonas sp. TaxID=2039626 RepID=UPI003351EF87
MLTFIDITPAQWQSGAVAQKPPVPEPSDSTETRDLLDAMGAIVVKMDVSGVIQYTNHAYAKLVGSSAANVCGRDIRDLLETTEEVNSINNSLSRLRNGETNCVYLRIRWVAENGTPHFIEGSCTAQRDAAGCVQSFVLAGVDITERRRMDRHMATQHANERHRISQSLHETLGMHLAATAISVQNLKNKVERGEACSAEDLDAVAQALRDGTEKARQLSHTLVPVSLQQGRFAEALDDLAREEAERFHGTCRFISYPPIPSVTNQITALLMYRVAEEGVRSARQHAAPDHIVVRLFLDGEHLCLSIRNDKRDWTANRDDPSVKQGLARMRYWAQFIGGALHVSRTPDSTTVVCRVPVSALRPPPPAE